MRFFVGLLSLAVLCAFVSAQAEYYQPEAEEILVAEDGYEPVILVEAPVHYRQKRATCDLLSGTGVAHSACATHCVLRGYNGGWCNSKAVCNCRR